MSVYHIFMISLFGWLLVLSLYKEDYLRFFLNVCPFDYTTFAVSGKVGYPLTDLTTPVG